MTTFLRTLTAALMAGAMMTGPVTAQANEGDNWTCARTLALDRTYPAVAQMAQELRQSAGSSESNAQIEYWIRDKCVNNPDMTLNELGTVWAFVSWQHDHPAPATPPKADNAIVNYCRAHPSANWCRDVK